MKTRICILAIALAALSPPAEAFKLGVNTRHPPAANEQVASLMKQRHFVSARIDLMWDRDVGALRDQASRLRAQGGNVQAVLQTSHQWNHRCEPDLAAVERRAYREAADTVNKVKDLIQDFELLNETQLRPEIMKEVTWNTAGQSTAPYEGKPCVATLAAALRGMSRAIADVRAESGQPLRIILGTVGRDFGFLRFMRSQGVQWDVTGFHVYPHYGTRSLLDDPWYGPGGPLAQLASFGKPVHINEFNCGEIYDEDYENAAGRRLTETCLQSLARHLKDLKRQTVARLEYVHLYELFDEPHKDAPENRFGLIDAGGKPKPHLLLVSALAGGSLSPQERPEITRRALLGEAEIGARR